MAEWLAGTVNYFYSKLESFSCKAGILFSVEPGLMAGLVYLDRDTGLRFCRMIS